MRQCLAAFGCGSTDVDHEGDCYLRCSWAVLGAAGYRPLVDLPALLAAFEHAFEAVGQGGCPPLQ